MENTQLERIQILRRMILESETRTQSFRKELTGLILGAEHRRCEIEIYFNQSEQTYITRFYQEDELIHKFTTKRYCRGSLAIGLESVNNQKPRIPWKEINASAVWKANAVIREAYWERHIGLQKPIVSKVIQLDAYRI